MNPNTDPLDRMNYFNGQRLEADDFRLEQDYHMRVRRLLNSSLFTYGIASGLEVAVKEGDPHRVVVSPGLALDLFGQEIVVLEAVELLVTGQPSLVEGVVLGNYLTIRYTEAPVDSVQDGCKVMAAGGQRLAWGGPTRLRSGVALEWQNSWPAEDSGLIVLVQAELDESCAVRDLRVGVRRYVGSRPAGAMTYALEGAHNIDFDNPKRLYFHIRGGPPEAVTLYLRGDKFSSLYYTELGKHDHDLIVELENHQGVSDHTHLLGELTTGTEPGHDHKITANTSKDNRNGLELSDNTERNNLITKVDMIVELAGDHSHTIDAGEPTGKAVDMPVLNHVLEKANVGKTGASTPARTPVGGFNYAAYDYPEDLQVWVNGADFSAEILNRLGWARMGDGSPNHPLVIDGSGEIRIDLLGVDLSEGEHLIELRLPTGGGQVLYNLYVE